MECSNIKNREQRPSKSSGEMALKNFKNTKLRDHKSWRVIYPNFILLSYNQTFICTPRKNIVNFVAVDNVF